MTLLLPYTPTAGHAEYADLCEGSASQAICSLWDRSSAVAPRRGQLSCPQWCFLCRGWFDVWPSAQQRERKRHLQTCSRGSPPLPPLCSSFSLLNTLLLLLLQTYPYSRTKALAEQDVIAANAKGKALLLCRCPWLIERGTLTLSVALQACLRRLCVVHDSFGERATRSFSN